MNDIIDIRVSELDMLGMLNMLTYETYAKIQRQLLAQHINRRPTFSEYLSACYRTFDLTSLAVPVWYHAYEYIADLFDDNERFGTPCDEQAVFEKQSQEVCDIVNAHAKRLK